MSLRTFHLVETEPHPLVAEALSTELFERCRIERPVPVHFLPMPRLGGSCPAIEDTREGELRLADHLLIPQKQHGWMVDAITNVYLHEIAHRLTPGHRHNPAFVATNALLLARADVDRHERPWVWTVDLYDMQDWDEVEHCTLGEALDWSLAQAQELGPAELSAEAGAEEIIRRFEVWKEWKGSTEQREAEAEVAKRRTAATTRGLQEQAEKLKQERWRWLAAGIVGGSMLNLVFMLLMKGA